MNAPNEPPDAQVVLPLPNTLADRIHTRAAAADMTDEVWITRILEEHLTGTRP